MPPYTRSNPPAVAGSAPPSARWPRLPAPPATATLAPPPSTTTARKAAPISISTRLTESTSTPYTPTTSAAAPHRSATTGAPLSKDSGALVAHGTRSLIVSPPSGDCQKRRLVENPEVARRAARLAFAPRSAQTIAAVPRLHEGAAPSTSVAVPSRAGVGSRPANSWPDRLSRPRATIENINRSAARAPLERL